MKGNKVLLKSATIQTKLFLIYHLPDPFGVVRLPCVMASSNRAVIASVAKQSSLRTPLDCFVTSFLAKTIQF